MQKATGLNFDGVEIFIAFLEGSRSQVTLVSKTLVDDEGLKRMKNDFRMEADKKAFVALMAHLKAEGLTLAAAIQEIGFYCRLCGECCRGEDNSVVVFPQDVRSIQEATGLAWLEVAGPPQEGVRPPVGGSETK